jgi:hypothetical protein
VKLPSHNTVIAYLALFVALGGTAFAATQLPKNSVGSKQLKPNAVTAAKIKNGAVNGSKIGPNAITGANVDESTLGRVPSAGSAESAATAGHANSATNAGHATTAGNANTLGGVPSSGFLRTGDVQFGSGALNACFAQNLIEIPGWFRITTVGDCKPEFKFTVTNLSSETWLFMSETSISNLAPSSSNVMDFGAGKWAVDLYAISADNQSKHALIDCGFQTTTPARISCTAQIPPAA